MRFEWFVSRRYLASRERRGIISLITVISIGGVACGGVASNRRKRFAVRGLIVGPQFPPVLRGRNGLGRRRSGPRWVGIDNKLAVVRMLPAKVIADFDLAIAAGQLIHQYGHHRLDLRANELPTNPSHERNDSAHKCGLPLFFPQKAHALPHGGRQPTSSENAMFSVA